MKSVPEILNLEVSVEDIIPLRHEILRPGMPVTSAHFDGDRDAMTYHFATYIKEYPEEPICCVSYMYTQYGTEAAYQLRGMATTKHYQKQGIGKQLTDFAEQYIREGRNIHLFWCNARVSAIGFYINQGWDIVSNEFIVPTVGPHKKMLKRYPNKIL